MKKREPVTKIMSKDLITLQLNEGLAKAEMLFKENHVRHIPVVKGDKIEGMLSQTDLMRISFVDNYDLQSVDTAVYDMLSLEQVMVRNPVCISPAHTIKEVAEELASREFHALPVVEGDKLVGIVTSTDLINYLIDQY